MRCKDWTSERAIERTAERNRHKIALVAARNRADDLAKALLSLADDAGMPDSAWQEDSRVRIARNQLYVDRDQRYTRNHLWAADA